jgi:hypothetical protein
MAQPGASLTMFDTQWQDAAAGALLYNQLGTLDIWDATIHYHGNLATLQCLIVAFGTIFYWG